jgi:GNAT superfamily N-acetyltransferase
MMISTSTDELKLAHAWWFPTEIRVRVRTACPQDTDTIQAYFRALSPASRRNRFLGALNEVSANELYAMTHSDRGSHPLLIAEHIDDNGLRTMIGEARYATVSGEFACEFAVSVSEVWQRRTLGTLLITILESRTKALGLCYLVGDVLRTNKPMLALARKVGFRITDSISDASLVKITKKPTVWSAAQPRNEVTALSRPIAA